MADTTPQTQAASDPYNIGAALTAGYSPTAIADYLGAHAGVNIGDARAAGYSDSEIVNFLAPPPAPAAPAPPPSSMLAGVGKAAAQIPTDVAGSILNGTGAMVSSAGGVLKSTAENAEAFARAQFGVMDQIDAGNPVAPTDDPLGYADASPDQRATIRADLEKSIAETPPPEDLPLGEAGGALQAAGGAVHGAGAAVTAYGEAAHPLTDEEQQRYSVQAVKAVGGLIPYVGAALAGGLPAVIGLAGVQGFGQGYDAAKAAGASDEMAATRGTLEGLASAGLMTVPIAKAMDVAASVPAMFKGQFLKVLLESVKSGATLTAFSQIQTIADNAVAKVTTEPDQSLTAGVGQNLVPTFLAGAVIPAFGAGFQAAARLARPAVRDVLKAGNVDQAIAAARAVASANAPLDVATTAATLDASEDPTDQQQAKLLRMFGNAGAGTLEQAPDGTHALRTPDGATVPIQVWNPDEPTGEFAQTGPTIPPETAQAIRDHYAAAGVDTVFYQDHPAIPFDGSADPQQPDTIFVSNNPQRAVAQVAGHEFTHVLADTTLPNGTSLGDLLNQQIAAGLTPEGQRYAEGLFGATAPQRAAFPTGPEGDATHAAAVQAHLVNELGADIGAEAPKFQSFLPRVIDSVQQRFGNSVAADVLGKLISGLKTALDTVRGLFGDTPTVSQNWVSNIGDIHDTLAKMYAERFGSPVEREQAALDAMRDQGARDRFVREAGLQSALAQMPAPAEVPPEATAAAEHLARVRAVEQQLANPDLGAADRRQLSTRRDELLADTTPEQLEAAARPIEDARRRAAVESQLADIGTERTQARADLTLGPQPITPEAASQIAAGTAERGADLRAKALTYRRWLTGMGEEQAQAAAATAQATLLRQTEAAILRPVGGDADRLAPAPAIRLADVRARLDAALRPAGDTPEMAAVRNEIGATREAMAAEPELEPLQEPATEAPHSQLESIPAGYSRIVGYERVDTEAPHSQLESIDPRTARVDAARFQFKSNGDEHGVTDRLQGVSTWDERLAGLAMVWRDPDGQVWVVDGHQRFALANRLMDAGHPPIHVNAFVLDAADGITEGEARFYAAAKNIAEGTGSPIDAAKVFREATRTGVELPEMPPRSVLARDGQALARLGDDAFGMAVNDVVPTNQAALVGRLVNDPAEQVEAMRVLAEAKPENARQAEIMIRDMLASGMEHGTTQAGLFGEEAFASSVTLERAKILDEAARQLARDRSTFQTLVAESDRIEAHGANALDAAANRERLSADEQASQVITGLATRRGPVSDALTGIARRFKSGDLPRAAAAREFLGAVRAAVAGRLDQGADAGGAVAGEAGRVALSPRRLPLPLQAGTDLLGRETPEAQPRAEREPTIRGDARQVDMFGRGDAAVQAQAARDQAGRGGINPRGEVKPADEGLFRPPETPQRPLFSPRITGADREIAPYTPDELAAYERVGRINDEPSFRLRLQMATADLWRRTLRYTLDPYIGVKESDPAGYMALRNANTTAGATEMFLTDGTLKFNGSAYAMADRNGGVEHLLVRPLHGEQDRFLWWVAANRAERLTAEDRENLWSPEDIAAIKGTNRGQVEFDYTLPNGSVTHSREAIYADSLRKLDLFNRNVLDLASESGLLEKGHANALLANPFYVPFYRQAEGDAHFAGARISSGFVKQNAFKALKGGTEKLNHDLWQNAIGNWSHMIDASLRNRAARGVLDTAATNGAAREVTAQDVQHLMTNRDSQGVVWVMDGGEKRYFQITDPMLHTAITALDFSGFRNGPMRAMTKFKTWLTIGVTADPRFLLRLSIRDAEQAIATAPMSYNMVGNVITGFRMGDFRGALGNLARSVAGAELNRLKLSDASADVIAGGGTMRLGSGHDTGVRTTDLATMLDSPNAIKAFWNRVGTFARAYKEMSAQGEDVQRFALYKKLIAEGVPHDAASFAARDLEDFTLRGAGTIVRGLTQMVPFMNAWAQGLYKVGRSAADSDRNVSVAVGMRVASSATRRVITVLGATTLATLALDSIYQDDEDYKKRDENDRNSNFWFKFGGVQFHIPMGFEVAALSRIAANGVEAFFNQEMTARRFIHSVGSIFLTTMAMDPIPQIVRPLLDLAENQTGTGSPIVPEGMKDLRPEAQYNSGTTLLARGISSAGNAAARAIAGPQGRFLAPMQIDYLVNGYFGWLGSMIAGTADRFARNFADVPTRPAMDLWNFATGGMVSTQTTPQSRYVDLLYEQADGINRAFNTYRYLLTTGRQQEASDFYAENKALIARHPLVADVQRFEATQNQMARRIENDPNRSAESKRVGLMAIDAARNRMAERAFGGANTP